MPALPPLRVAVVNDYELVVRGLAAMLAEHAGRVDVVELDSRVPTLSEVDVVLLDTFARPQGEYLALEDLDLPRGAKVVVFSWNLGEEAVQPAVAAGAHGYVSKGVGAAELVELLLRVHAGEVVTPVVEPMPEGDQFGRWPGDEQGLSPRESEVLALICRGHTNKEVARELFLGINTVKTYIRTLYAKIGATSRSRAVLWGMEHGFGPDRARHR